MATKPKPESTARRGRPRVLPPGTKLRTMRLTDAEYRAVLDLVAGLRTFTPANVPGVYPTKR